MAIPVVGEVLPGLLSQRQTADKLRTTAFPGSGSGLETALAR